MHLDRPRDGCVLLRTGYQLQFPSGNRYRPRKGRVLLLYLSKKINRMYRVTDPVRGAYCFQKSLKSGEKQKLVTVPVRGAYCFLNLLMMKQLLKRYSPRKGRVLLQQTDTMKVIPTFILLVKSLHFFLHIFRVTHLFTKYNPCFCEMRCFLMR